MLEADGAGRPPGGDHRAPQPRVRRALRRDAPPPRRPAGASSPRTSRRSSRRSRSTTWSSRGCSRSPASTSSSTTTSARARCPASWPASPRRARRAPPRGLRRALPARHGSASRATAPPSSARWSRSVRWPTACCARSGSTAATTTPCSSARSVSETRAFALQALKRRLKVIGLRRRLTRALTGLVRRARSSARRCPTSSGALPRMAPAGDRGASSCWSSSRWWRSASAPRPRTGRQLSSARPGRLQPALSARAAGDPARAQRVVAPRAPRGRQFVDSFAVSPLHLPPYKGDVSAVLPLVASRAVELVAQALPGPRAGRRGQARINQQPGYQIVFRVSAQPTRPTASACCSRSPCPPRETASILLLLARPPATPRKADAVGANGAAQDAVPLVALRHRGQP